MKYQNYFPIKKFSLRYKYFCFADAKGYFADALLIKHEVRVWFQQEGHKEGADFVVVFCKIRKSDIDGFVQAMEELKGKMLLCGYSNYQNFCEELSKNILEKDKEE